MKYLLLFVMVLTYFSNSQGGLPAMPDIPPTPVLPSIPISQPATVTPSPSTAQSEIPQTTTAPTAPTMDATLENDMANRIASIMYSSVDDRVQTLIQLQNQATQTYISPYVQYNYYTAIYKAYSDLLATTKTQNTSLIRRFIDLLKKLTSSTIIDSNQKAQINAMIPQLMQKIADLSKPASTKSQKTPTQGAQTTQVRGAKIR